MRQSLFLMGFLAAMALPLFGLCAQTPDSVADNESKHSIDFSPLSPAFKIYAIHYCYRLTPRSEVIIGPLYANIHYKDIGHTDAPGFIVGFRQYLWKSVHIDYQLMPEWDRFYEQNENKRYKGFDLWNEFRLGCVWDFKLGNLPAFINFQWPFGFALYSQADGKTESFKKHVRENPLFYFPPMFFVGIRL